VLRLFEKVAGCEEDFWLWQCCVRQSGDGVGVRDVGSGGEAEGAVVEQERATK
jgi:hypothetical protein